MTQLLRLNMPTLTLRNNLFACRGFVGTGFAGIRFSSFQSFLGASRPAALQRISQSLLCRHRVDQLLSRSIRSYPRAALPKRSAWETFKRRVNDIEPTNFVKGIIAANVAVWLAFQYGNTARVRTLSLCSCDSRRCTKGTSACSFVTRSIRPISRGDFTGVESLSAGGGAPESRKAYLAWIYRYRTEV
jgi:hypothetical protein